MEKTHGRSQSSVQCRRDCMQKRSRFLFQNWQGYEDILRTIGELVRKTRSHPLFYIEYNIFNVYMNKEVKSTDNNIVNTFQQSGNEYGRAVRSQVQRKDGTTIWPQLVLTSCQLKCFVKMSR